LKDLIYGVQDNIFIIDLAKLVHGWLSKFLQVTFCKGAQGILGQVNARIFFCTGAIWILAEHKECRIWHVITDDQKERFNGVCN